MYVRVLHGCILHVRACTTVRCIAFTYHLLVIFPYDFSPSGRVHYVTCIGDGYMLQNLYQMRHMLYQPIWLYALCDLYWEQVHAAKNLYRAHIISLMVIWLRVCTSGSYYISPSGCVHYVTCIGNRYMLQTYIDTYYITSDYMTACVVHIGTYIISAHLAVCIM